MISAQSVVLIFSRNEPPNPTEYRGERPEMSFSRRGINEGQNKKRKLVYEKRKHHVHKNHRPEVEGPAHQVGPGAGDRRIDHASVRPARPSLRSE